jgi:hypothetical protein
VAPSDIAVQCAKKDAKGGKKWRKRHPQWVVAMANYEDDNKKVDGSDEECIVATDRPL